MSSQNKPSGPSFICAGVPRSGTTWLHNNLRGHPQLWLPPTKELHYWDFQRPGASANYPLPNRVAVSWLLWRVKHIRQLFQLLTRGRVRPSWALRYIFGWRSDRWYARLFPTDRVAGEITPNYMLLKKPAVEAIYRVNPDLKIIFLLRDPVSRAWSNLGLRYGKRKLALLSDEKILKAMAAPGMTMRGDYVRTLKIWRSIFAEKQIFIGFYDDLKENPRQLLHSILTFLGVDASDVRLPADIGRVVHSRSGRQLPEPLLPQLYAPYLNQLRELETMLGGHASKWLAKAEELLAKAPVDRLQPQVIHAEH